MFSYESLKQKANLCIWCSNKHSGSFTWLIFHLFQGYPFPTVIHTTLFPISHLRYPISHLHVVPVGDTSSTLHMGAIVSPWPYLHTIIIAYNYFSVILAPCKVKSFQSYCDSRADKRILRPIPMCVYVAGVRGKGSHTQPASNSLTPAGCHTIQLSSNTVCVGLHRLRALSHKIFHAPNNHFGCHLSSGLLTD